MRRARHGRYEETRECTENGSCHAAPSRQDTQEHTYRRRVHRLNKLLKDLTSADMSNPIVEAKFGNITPQALNTQLTLLMSLKHARGFDPTQSFDDYFQKFAKRNHEPVIGLETVDKQIEVLFKSIPLERQKQLLMCLVDNTEYYNMVTQRLSDAYFAQNMKQIEEVISEKRNDSCDDTKEEYAIMFDNRNADWVAKMPAIMSDKPTFFAVGAGHLPGRKGCAQPPQAGWLRGRGSEMIFQTKQLYEETIFIPRFSAPHDGNDGANQ